jgi:aminopeptidase
MDCRINTLAKKLVDYSCKVKKGEKVLIEGYGTRTTPLIEKLIERIYEKGAYPFYSVYDDQVLRAFQMGCQMEQMKLEASWQRLRMENMDCYIGVRSTENKLENSDIPSEQVETVSKTVWQKVHVDIRVPKTRWVVLRFPNPTFAQTAKMSTRAFEDFFYKACNMDYTKMSAAMDHLVSYMNKTDKVKITGKGTDLSFSIKDIPAVKCDGVMNIPDGEVYTAPVKDSVNGKSFSNAPTIYDGSYFEGISLTWKDGKITECDCAVGDKQKLLSIFDRDAGARYAGEFALGVNPYITQAMMETLFDEKIAGSFHFTPGASYDDADNGNKSAVHWDMVYMQTPEFGGGEMYFDDVLIRKDGLFVVDELKCLNPENLKD